MKPYTPVRAEARDLFVALYPKLEVEAHFGSKHLAVSIRNPNNVSLAMTMLRALLFLEHFWNSTECLEARSFALSAAQSIFDALRLLSSEERHQKYDNGKLSALIAPFDALQCVAILWKQTGAQGAFTKKQREAAGEFAKTCKRLKGLLHDEYRTEKYPEDDEHGSTH